MCLLFVYLNSNPGPEEFSVILVNNRDEYYSRPTRAARVWETNPQIIGGEDRQPGREGGTWMAMSKTGKIASILNIFHPKDQVIPPNKKGRGHLINDFLLTTNDSVFTYLKKLKEKGESYRLFSLFFMEFINNKPKAFHYNNINGQTLNIGDGIHGFSNSLPNEPYQKVNKGKKMFEEIIKKRGTQKRENDLIESLFVFMQSGEPQYPDTVLRTQGKGYSEDYLKELSSMWISMSKYGFGTRTTTVILVDSKNRVTFKERTLKNASADCSELVESEFKFML